MRHSARRQWLLVALLAVTWLWCTPASAGSAQAQALNACFAAQAERFGLSAYLLRSIAKVESGLRPEAMNYGHVSRTGSHDIGLMQINSGWLPTLRQYGITEQELASNPCTNIEVGAWILADLVARHGNSWDAVGAYNAACTQLGKNACRQARSAYTWKVWRAMNAAPQPVLTPPASATAPALALAPPARRPATPGLVSLALLSVPDPVQRSAAALVGPDTQRPETGLNQPTGETQP